MPFLLETLWGSSNPVILIHETPNNNKRRLPMV